MQKQFDSLDSYLGLAKKTISKFAPKFYNGLASEMLRNNDAISDVATAIMYADWRFNPDRVGKSGQKKTLYSYRNQCALWAIKTYVTNKYKKKTNNISLDYETDNDIKILNLSLKDHKAINPLDTLIEKENKENLTEAIQQLFDNSLLSEKQKEQIRLYYFENETLSSIGKKFGVSREAIRQNLKRAIENIKQYDTVSN
ncbi:MAG: sigma-70 family RNA polymerase sigma factor [Caulobacteraceae bacterium]|nr:sigma-70 family RNA polymerase sigma factor [Caulobacteraceae bacterium]